MTFRVNATNPDVPGRSSTTVGTKTRPAPGTGRQDRAGAKAVAKMARSNDGVRRIGRPNM